MSSRKNPNPKKTIRDGADEESSAPSAQLSTLVLSRMQPMYGPPKSDEEKREFLTQLVRLKEQRATHKECAEKLGVAVSTIANYVNDPLYREIQQDLIADAKQTGHLLISEVIPEAINELYTIMKGDKSGFVRFKAAEALLNYAGYNMPREEAHNDSREGLQKFLSALEEKQKKTTQVNVQINMGGNQESVVVDATAPSPEIPEQLVPFYTPVLPGGKLPTSSSTRTDDNQL